VLLQVRTSAAPRFSGSKGTGANRHATAFSPIDYSGRWPVPARVRRRTRQPVGAADALAAIDSQTDGPLACRSAPHGRLDGAARALARPRPLWKWPHSHRPAPDFYRKAMSRISPPKHRAEDHGQGFTLRPSGLWTNPIGSPRLIEGRPANAGPRQPIGLTARFAFSRALQGFDVRGPTAARLVDVMTTKRFWPSPHQGWRPTASAREQDIARLAPSCGRGAATLAFRSREPVERHHVRLAPDNVNMCFHFGASSVLPCAGQRLSWSRHRPAHCADNRQGHCDLGPLRLGRTACRDMAVTSDCRVG